MTEQTHIDFEGGIVLNINKPYGWTSTDVVRKVKGMLRHLGYKKIKIGHAGTLDPLATGVLLVCIGRATKRVNELQDQTKEYVTTMELGATTPSFDLEHDIDQRYPFEHITEEMVRQLLEKMRGDQDQVPPLFSAKRVNGKRAYELARDGKEVELRTSPIKLYELELMEFTPPYIKIRVECSKGTYIRSLARDIGLELDSGGHLTQLERSRSGEYTVAEALTLEQLEQQFKALAANQEHGQ